jgi:RNA polymerase subunit RPABC4/transcription elongation factor Spt4
MEITCYRCHQSIQADNCYCPVCGLPQLTYSAEGVTVPTASENWPEAVRDASSIDWKSGMRAAVIFAVPAGLFSSGISPLSPFGLVWMTTGAALAVLAYIRSQKPAWITIGAGARIGLVTGLLAAWVAFGISGTGLYLERTVFHQSSAIDSDWKERVDASQQLTEKWAAQMGVTDAAQVNAQRNWMLSPEGRAGFQTFGVATNCIFLVFFAMGGGALGARFLVRSRRPEV